MIRSADVVRQLVGENLFLRIGLNQRLLNLSQVAQFILPQVCARLKKEVQLGSIVMSLSRLQREFEAKEAVSSFEFRIESLTVHTDLVIVTYPKTELSHRGMSDLHSRVRKNRGHFTVTEGINEITAIIERKHEAVLNKLLPEKPLFYRADVASLGVKFPASYLHEPGFLYLILQQLYFQNINIIELSSTATELIVYLAHQDVRLAFDTIHGSFSKASGVG